MFSLMGFDRDTNGFGQLSLSSRNLIGLSFLILSLSVIGFYFSSLQDTSTVRVSLQYPKTAMSITDSTFWDKKNSLHGFEKFSTAAIGVCKNFFGLWPSDCTDKFVELDERIRVISSQMKPMNTSFTLFVTGMDGCSFNYPGIYVLQFNSTELLLEYGFNKTLEKMSTWKKTRFTRISDILRIALAHRFQMSYIDTDMHFLHLRKDLYEQSYVGAAVWSNMKNALEMTNAAFCLPRPILLDMINFQINRIMQGSDKFFYTELGPSMFHNVSVSEIITKQFGLLCC